jgi:ATP-dependent exoDNAse (exonuclease V), alpha subunit - helicase superfamily I member
MIVNGYAGTGKTSAIGVVVRVLESLSQRVVLLAPTGRAAKVFSTYSGKSAFTIHKQIYRQKVASDLKSEFNLNHNIFKDTLFIVDEASMISNQAMEQSVFGSGNLLRDLVDYVNEGKNCKLLLIGDDAQLPPVGMEGSPALNNEVMMGFGKVLYTRLTEVVRQAAGSGILANATAIRLLLNEETLALPYFDIQYEDVDPVTGVELLELLETCYGKFGRDQVVVITRSNKRANLYNSGIRQRILYREDSLSIGDSVMVVKNNYFWTASLKEIDFIANGDIAIIERIGRYVERYGLTFVDVSLRFPDYNDLELDAKIIINTLSSDSASLSYEQNRILYEGVNEDYQDIPSRKKRWLQVREDPFYNALQVKFAYAITCHKAQGGQWPVVFIDHGYFTKEMLSIDFLRWLYTALTRATVKLFLVNFDKDFF